MESIDLKHVCRLCAKEDRYCIDVFGVDGSNNSIAKKVRLCLPITIKEDDEYPKQICLACLSKLDTSYELYSGCMNAQSTIKKLIDIAKQKFDVHEQSASMSMSAQGGQGNVISLEQPKLSATKPFMKIGNTVVKLQDLPNENDSIDLVTEPRIKVRKIQIAEHNTPTVLVDNTSRTELQSVSVIKENGMQQANLTSNSSASVQVSSPSSVTETYNTPYILRNSSKRTRHSQELQLGTPKQQIAPPPAASYMTSFTDFLTSGRTKPSLTSRQEGSPNIITAPNIQSSLHHGQTNMLTGSSNYSLSTDSVSQPNVIPGNSVLKSQADISRESASLTLRGILGRSTSQNVASSQKNYIPILSEKYNPVDIQQSQNLVSVHPISCACFLCNKVRETSKASAFTTTVSAITTTLCATKDRTLTSMAKIPTTSVPISSGISRTSVIGPRTLNLNQTYSGGGMQPINISSTGSVVPISLPNITRTNIMNTPLLQQQHIAVMPMSNLSNINTNSVTNMGVMSSLPNTYYATINKTP